MASIDNDLWVQHVQTVCEYCYHRYNVPLCAIAWGLLSPPCVGQCGDVVHDAFIDFQRSVQRGRLRCLRGGGWDTPSLDVVGPSCCAYLTRIVSCKCAKLMSREAQRLQVYAGYGQIAGERLERSASDCCEWRELRGLVHDSLERLSERERVVVVLREFSGLSYGAIGRQLKLPIRTVETRLRRARAKLRWQLARHVDYENGDPFVWTGVN